MVPPEAAFKLSPHAIKAGLSACCAGTQLPILRLTGLSCACALPRDKAERVAKAAIARVRVRCWGMESSRGEGLGNEGYEL